MEVFNKFHNDHSFLVRVKDKNYVLQAIEIRNLYAQFCTVTKHYYQTVNIQFNYYFMNLSTLEISRR